MPVEVFAIALRKGTGFKRPRVGATYRARDYMDIDRRFLRGNRNAARLRGARRNRRRRYNYPSLTTEPKFYDTSFASTGITSNATFASLSINPSASSLISTPAVGDSESNRDGKKIIITQVEVKGAIIKNAQVNQTAAEEPESIWIALVLDTQTNATACASTDVFKPLCTGAATSTQPFRNLLYGGRFRIIKMKRYILQNAALSYDGTNLEQNGIMRNFKFFKKMRLPVNFNAGTTSDIANVTDNSLHMMAWSSLGLTYISYGARIRFIG